MSGEVKIILVGDSSVGKTTLLNAFMNKDVNPSPTISPESQRISHINSNNIKVDMIFWDTAGQEEYNSLGTVFYRGSQIALICFDYEHLNTIRKWADRVLDVSPNCILLLIGTKHDMMNNQQINEMNATCDHIVNSDSRFKTSFITSSVTGWDVEATLDFIADIDIQTSATTLNLNSDQMKKGCCA